MVYNPAGRPRRAIRPNRAEPRIDGHSPARAFPRRHGVRQRDPRRRTCLSVPRGRQLRNLAIELHADLFVRLGKRFVPTPAAERLSELAKDVVRQVRAIERLFAKDPAQDVRPFHLATGATTLIHRPPPAPAGSAKYVPPNSPRPSSCILPESALQDRPRYFEMFRVPYRRIVRGQALAMMKSEYPRALTLSIARFLQSTLTAGPLPVVGQFGF
jgi:hypothetical protein